MVIYRSLLTKYLAHLISNILSLLNYITACNQYPYITKLGFATNIYKGHLLKQEYKNIVSNLKLTTTHSTS